MTCETGIFSGLRLDELRIKERDMNSKGVQLYISV